MANSGPGHKNRPAADFRALWRGVHRAPCTMRAPCRPKPSSSSPSRPRAPWPSPTRRPLRPFQPRHAVPVRPPDDIPTPRVCDAYSLDEIRFGGRATPRSSRWRLARRTRRRSRACRCAGRRLFRITVRSLHGLRSRTRGADQGRRARHDQAAWQLAQLAANSTVWPDHRAALERCSRRRDARPIRGRRRPDHFLRQRHGAERQVQQYTYARVAAGYWEANKVTVPRQASTRRHCRKWRRPFPRRTAVARRAERPPSSPP
jgi:hypothetical protein